jgi:predicted PurR-regulated permease PerM
MNAPNENRKLNEIFSYVVEITIRLVFLALLIAWCFQILLPFSGILLWGFILAIILAPLQQSLKKRLGDKPKWAAAIIIVCGIAMIVLPSWLFLDSTISGVKAIRAELGAGTLTIPPPTEKVKTWPVIGAKAYEIWEAASDNLQAFSANYKEQIIRIGGGLLEKAMSIGGSILKFILSMIIAGVLLVSKGTENMGRKFFRRLLGARGDEFTDITVGTVRNVAKGVIGVALIQALLVGAGFLLAGVPHAGLWALVVLILAILQLPALIIVLPIVIWLFSVLNPVPAILWTVYLLLAGISDNVLKPILLGKGAAVPMLVIFLGVIGGFMLSGFIGLFTGAIIVSLGYKLFIAWLENDDQRIRQNQVVQPISK